MTRPDAPYGAALFHFQVDFGAGVRAGFAEVSGLSSEASAADYRDPQDANAPARTPPGLRKSADITLKRGMVPRAMFDWINAARLAGILAKRSVRITLLDAASRGAVRTWRLDGAMPIKWSGPTLSGEGGGDVAMEELVLSSESVALE